MGSLAPPDGWELGASTVWGRDIDREESVTLAGGSGLIFKSGYGGVIYTPWAPAMARASGSPIDRANTDNASEAHYIRMRADRINAGDNVTVEYEYVDTNFAVVFSGTEWATAPLTAIDTWQTAGRVSSVIAWQWGRFKITKAATAFNLYVDSVVSEGNSVYGRNHGGISSPQTIATGGAWQKVVLDWLNTAFYETDFYTVNNEFQINIPGFYLVTGRVTYDTLPAGEQASLRFKSVALGAYLAGNTHIVSGSAAYAQTIALTAVNLYNVGDGIGLETTHTYSSDLDISDAQLTVVRIPR